MRAPSLTLGSRLTFVAFTPRGRDMRFIIFLILFSIRHFKYTIQTCKFSLYVPSFVLDIFSAILRELREKTGGIKANVARSNSLRCYSRIVALIARHSPLSSDRNCPSRDESKTRSTAIFRVIRRRSGQGCRPGRSTLDNWDTRNVVLETCRAIFRPEGEREIESRA